MEKEIRKIDADKSVDTCPACGYSDGFHVSFKIYNETRNIILICPQCHERFDPDWKTI
ncbi:MAG: hypothetical protein SV062_11005 [Thermodesulfobacteriota bacterium]|nr:hypothetical protein [Thermodesulfobacteriota bacterium]